MKKIDFYRNTNGRKPFIEWIKKIPFKEEQKVDAYIKRVALGGSKKNVSPVGESIYEIKIDYGPGIRVYFGMDKDSLILLGGGYKKTQFMDILEAKKCWRDYETSGKL
jgi:putative addiction module killer protein